jgi:hypothetical protein
MQPITEQEQAAGETWVAVVIRAFKANDVKLVT